MSREVLNRSIDARQVPSILARASGGNSEAVVIRGEIDELIEDVTSKITQLRAETSQANQADTTNWQDAIATLNQTIEQRWQGIKGKYAVSCSVSSLADLNLESLNTLPIDVNATDWHGWVLVREQFYENGVYHFRNNRWERVPQFANAADLGAGTEFYDDFADRYYICEADADPVSQTNPSVQRVNIIPYGRAEQLHFSGPLGQDGDYIRFNYNREYFQVQFIEGWMSLDFSDKFRDLIQGLAAADDALTDRINELNESLTALNQTLGAQQIQLEQMGTTLSTHTQQIGAVQTEIQNTTARFESLEAEVHEGLQPQVNNIEERMDLNQVAITGHTQQLQTQGATLSQQQTTLTQQTQQLAAQTQQLSTIDTSLTDARATIAAHTTELRQIESGLSSKLNTADLDAAQEAKLATLIKDFVLTGGVTERRTDPDDNSTYYFTTFEASTGFGSLHFRAFDLSDTLSPYTKRGYSFTFQRVGVDSFRVMFQSSLSAFPDDQCSISLIRIPGK